MSKTRASCFIRGSKHLETIKALGLRPRAFICFSVFGTPDETLALVFDILPKEERRINDNLNCKSKNLIYLIERKKCIKQYIGETKR